MRALEVTLRRFISLLEVLAALLLAFMMTATVLDVTIRAVNPLWRFGGVYELIEISLVSSFYFALPAVFLSRTHITIDIIDNLVPSSVQAALKGLALVAGLVLLVGIGSQIVRPALDVVEFNETTMVLGIPKIMHWLAIWVGIYVSIAAVIVTLLRREWRQARPEASLE